MRELHADIIAALSNRQAIKARLLWWIEARNRSTGVTEPIGFWNGDDNRQFVINGDTRTYYAAGNILGFGTLTLEAALNIRMFSIQGTHVTVEMQQALRGYETRFAPTELHTVLFNVETDNIIASPFRVFKGWVNRLKIKTPKVNETGSATIDLVGATRLLTKKLASKRSDQTQRMRNSSDAFFKDVSMTGTVTTPWGEKGVSATASDPYADVKQFLGSTGYAGVVR